MKIWQMSLIFLALFCVGAFAQQKGAFTDSRDGKKYETVKIGEQTWMAENLNYVTKDSKCYDNDPANCAKYGRLYNWDEAIKVCPSRWHLSTEDDWNDLVQAAGGSEAAGKKLKSTSGWHSNGNGTDDYGLYAPFYPDVS